MTNKEGATCVRAVRRIAQQANLREHGSVLQSDNDPSFVSDIFQEALAEIGLKHVRSKTYTSTSQAKVERVQATVVRGAVGRWKTATGRAVDADHRIQHRAFGNPRQAQCGAPFLAGAADMIAFVRANNFRAAKKLMGPD